MVRCVEGGGREEVEACVVVGRVGGVKERELEEAWKGAGVLMGQG